MAIDTLVEYFGKLDATNESAEHAIARDIIRMLGGYRMNSTHYVSDVETMVEAIQAYAKLLQINGVKVL